MLNELLSDLRYRLRALFKRDTLESQLDHELRFHLERETDKLERAGLSRDEARRQARLAFGGVDRAKEASRNARGVFLIETTLQDLRYALRGLRRKPGFTAAVTITLGLGIGANAAMFGVIDRLLFRPPPMMRDAASVHRVYLARTERGTEAFQHSFPYKRYTDLVDGTRSFAATAAFYSRFLAVGSGDDAREMQVAPVSASFFSFFDAEPALGRYFSAQEDTPPTGAPVVVVSHAFWQTHFGGQRAALGSALQIDRGMYTIIGVAPPGFAGINDRGAPAVFIPITAFAASLHPSYYLDYGWDAAELLVRRRPNVSVAAATADLSTAFQRSWIAENPSTTRLAAARPRAVAVPTQLGRGPEATRDTKLVRWVSGVAFVVLLIACANVANLLLARALKRRREIALRLALGVSRARLVRQMLTESLVLACLGGVAGLITAHWGGAVLRALFLTSEESTAVVTDPRTLWFAAIVTIVAALLTGLVPALQSGRGDLADTLKAGAREGTNRRSRSRTALLVFQSALSVALLVGAGLFVRSTQHVGAFRLGYDVDPVLFIAGKLRAVRPTPAERGAFGARILEAAASAPGVLHATRTQSVPFLGNEGRRVFVPGIDSTSRLGRFVLEAVSVDFFATTGTRILRGRGLTIDDRATAPRVALVTGAMAGILWPGREALGQCFRIGSDTLPCTTVVGIVEDIRSRSFTDPAEFHYYMPVAQYEQQFGAGAPLLFARVNGRASDYAEAVRQHVQRAMPGDSYVTVTPMRELVDPHQRAWRTGATMFVAFGGLALALAAIGLYSVIAYNVAERRHELGVRIALGAQARDVTRLVVRQGIGLASVGIVIGGMIALAAGPWVAPLLFAQSPRDPLIFGGVAAVLLGVAILASGLPALRAARVDPTEALRGD